MRLAAALHGGTCGKGRLPFFPREPPAGLQDDSEAGTHSATRPACAGPWAESEPLAYGALPQSPSLHRGCVHPTYGHRGHSAEPPAGPMGFCSTDCGVR